MTARILAATLAVAFLGCLSALLASIAHEQHQWDGGIHTYQGRVYDGSVLIGVCGGQPPVPGTLPGSSDPSVDVTWYPECPR